MLKIKLLDNINNCVSFSCAEKLCLKKNEFIEVIVFSIQMIIFYHHVLWLNLVVVLNHH